MCSGVLNSTCKKIRFFLSKCAPLSLISMFRRFHFAFGLLLTMSAAGCVAADGSAGQRTERPDAQAPKVRRIDAREAERLYRVMTPLLGVMDRPKNSKQVQVGVIDSREINAANAGGGQFYVTTGLLES